MASTSLETSAISDNDKSQSASDGVKLFDYENAEKKFELFLNRLCPRTVNLNNPSWASVIKFVMNAIREGKKKKNNYEEIDHFTQFAMKMYDISNDGKKEFLVYKENRQEPIVVIPNEECFKLLASIHLANGHADLDKMMNLIKDKYLISAENVSLFIKMCNICNKNEPYVNHSYYIFTIDLCDFQDNPYRYILTLVEKSTKFFILRPLVDRSPSEITLELLKFFADFGPPISLRTSEPNLYDAVNAKVSQMCPEYSVLIEQENGGKIANFDELVKYEISEWMSMTGSTNWATGCRMIQWRINNTETNNKTPFEQLFGVQPNDSLYTNPIWLTVSDFDLGKTYVNVNHFKSKYGVKNREIIQNAPSVITDVKDDLIITDQSTMKSAMVCCVCGHPITTRNNKSTCTHCKLPIHSFCGTRYAGKQKKLNILCVKCKK